MRLITAAEEVKTQFVIPRGLKPYAAKQIFVSWAFHVNPKKPDAKPQKIARAVRSHPGLEKAGRWLKGRGDTSALLAGTWDQAARAREKRGHDGIGVVLGADLGDGWVLHGADFDGVRNPETGEVEPWAQEALDSLDSYKEISPSGTGIKVLMRAKREELASFYGSHHNFKDTHEGAHKGLELHKTGFYTLTGRVYGPTRTPAMIGPEQLGKVWGLSRAANKGKPAERPKPGRETPILDIRRTPRGTADKQRGAEELAKIAATCAKGNDKGRTEALKVAALLAGGFYAGGWIDAFDAREKIKAACEENGFFDDYGDKDFDRHFNNLFKLGTESPMNLRGDPLDALGDESEPGFEPWHEIIEPWEAYAERMGFTGFINPPATLADLKARPPAEYAITGVLTRTGWLCAIGHPGSGKSIFLPELAFALAEGKPFMGRETKKMRGLYIGTEDPDGMVNRFRAFQHHRGVPDDFDNLIINTDGMNLRDPDEQKGLLRYCKALGVQVVFVDVQADAFEGIDENTAQGMGEVKAWARSMQRAGIAVVTAHHVPKNGPPSPRGFGNLKGALDSLFIIESDDTAGWMRATVDKSRTGLRKGEAFEFDLRVDDTLVKDANGRFVKIPYAVFKSDAPPVAATGPKLSPTQNRLVLAVGLGKTEAEARKAYRDATLKIEPTLKPDTVRKQFDRALEALTKLDVLKVEGDTIRPVNIIPAEDLFNDETGEEEL